MSVVNALFGEQGRKQLNAHALFLERAEREVARGRRPAASLALAGYVVMRLIDALLEFEDSDDGRAAFAWQRDATAKQLRELPDSAPEANHLGGIFDTIQPGESPRGALAISLTAYAYFLEYEGRLEEALDVLGLSAHVRGAHLSTTELASYALFAGKLHRLLSRWPQAMECYQAAEDAGRAAGDAAVMLRGRLHQGAVARGQGNLPKARDVAEAVALEATEQGLAQVQYLAYADLSAIYSLQGLPLEGIRTAYAAFLVATTPVDRMSALGDLGISLMEIGATEQARLALEIVAHAKTDFRIKTNAVLELLDLESAAGNRLAFERLKTAAETERDRMPPGMLVDYLFKVGVGQARFGLLDRARDSLTLALQTAETHALNRWYFRVEEALKTLRPDMPAPPAQHASELREAPVIYEVELGLREFRAATAVSA